MKWRSYMDSPYGTCQRSQQKWPLDDMVWDSGLLVAAHWADRNINGAFELAMAREAARDTKELQPEPKLYQPVDVRSQMEHISASAGTY